jgi:hypothetical protein
MGSPWTPAFYGQWQLAGEEAGRRHWARLLPPDAQVDILITHGPPFGHGDTTRGRHVGDKALLHVREQCCAVSVFLSTRVNIYTGINIYL